MNPLLLPEILLHLRRLIPSWTTPLHKGLVRNFRPKTLLACLLVCRAWNTALHPLLWHVLDTNQEESRYARISADTFSKNARHVRIFIGNPPVFGAAHCLPNLVELSFWTPNRDDSTSEEDTARCNMLALNSHIRKLTWEGPLDLQPLRTEPLTQLSWLTHLRLYQWQGSGGALKRVLDAVAATLISLQLDHVHGVEDTGLENVCLPLVTNLDITLTSMPTSAPSQGLWELVRRCPNLLSLEASLDMLIWIQLYQQPTWPSTWLRASAPPSLTSLEFTNLRTETEVLEAIQSIPTLASFKCEVSAMSVAIARTLVSCHARTLRRIHLKMFSGERFCIESCAILLESLPELESLHIDDCSCNIPEEELLERIFRQPWLCIGLKELCLPWLWMVHASAKDGCICDLATRVLCATTVLACAGNAGAEMGQHQSDRVHPKQCSERVES
ncbi:hypothetical protein BC939DRAFT_447056 [Gamsiella multidivaricata]|uniref:uncharacterized protein n=1 Tax=Gamsiella multidivaricata TaxID=101098 RepID=UPI002220FF7E|nr:uncharacterized protein BC939DRAFT_447056 [Gamsiella multidivaricata]KAI7826141.1 hypothetical protein BC939DRAFT_447056 [Gamsiella multidivaricata]